MSDQTLTLTVTAEEAAAIRALGTQMGLTQTDNILRLALTHACARFDLAVPDHVFQLRVSPATPRSQTRDRHQHARGR
jgi:hypothetical protein